MDVNLPYKKPNCFYRVVLVRLETRDSLDYQVLMAIQEMLDHKVLEETGYQKHLTIIPSDITAVIPLFSGTRWSTGHEG